MKHMKHIIGNIARFILSITLFTCIYLDVFKGSVITVCILLIFFALYGLCMGWGWKSIGKLKEYENKLIHFELTRKDAVIILLFALTTLSPIYFCVFIVSLIPLYTYEVWLITVFPCVVLNCLPASSVLEEYYGLTHKKAPFLMSFLILTIIFCLMGVITSSLVLQKFMA